MQIPDPKKWKMKIIIYLLIYNILSLSVVVVLFIHSSQFVIRLVIHPYKFLIPEEEDDGRGGGRKTTNGGSSSLKHIRKTRFKKEKENRN